MDELKPCPFCGGGGAGYMDDVQYPDTPNERTWYAVTCGKCDANGAWDLGKSGAAEKWNTRAVEDALRAEIGSLRALLTQLEWIMPRESWFWQYTQPKYCQLCGRFRHQGHAPDCKLAALLGAQGAQ